MELIMESGYCVTCNKLTKYISPKKGYKKFCSSSCANKHNNKLKNQDTNKLKALKYWENVDQNKIIEEYNRGNTIKEVSRITGYNYSTVRTCLVKNNVNMRKKYQYNQEKFFFERNPSAVILKDPEIFDKYTPKEIVEMAGVAYNTVHVHARNAGKPYIENKSVSYEEDFVFEHIRSNGISNIIRNDKTVLNGSEIDIYLPDYNLAIEINGIYWHQERFGKHKRYHLNKTKECENKGIGLLHFTDYEVNNKSTACFNIINSKLGLNTKIFARKTVFDYVKTNDAKKFMNKNHIQGFCGGSEYVGLYYNDILICCAIFGKSRFKSGDIELIRFATEYGYTVVGGMSKILKNVSYDDIVSYCERRYSNGNSYIKCGFDLINTTEPGYFYNINKVPENRFKYQKHKLKNILDIFDPNLTEYQNMLNNGYDRVWDCGQYVFRYKRE